MATPQAIRVSFELALRDVAIELDQGQGDASVPVTRVECALTAPPSDSSLAMTFRQLFKLAPAESRAFAALLAKNQVSRGELHQAITQADAPITDQKGIDVLVHKMRRKLARHHIAITAIWGLGFTIDRETRDRVHKTLAEHGIDIAGAATPLDQVDCKTKPVA